jgi:serine protease Do
MVSRPLSPSTTPRVRLLALGGLLLLGLLGPRPATAQTAILAASESSGMLSETRQAQLYEQLERETDFLQKQAAVVKTVAKLLGPSVVHIEADVTERRTLQHARGGQVEEAGSGVIINHGDKHYVLTNCHVVRGSRPENVRIRLADRRWIGPTKVWTDTETDVAVMAIDAPQVVGARLGNSDAIEVGDFVLTFGSPFGLSQSVTFGIVSAKNRRDLDLAGTGVLFQNFIQTDAAINPGNSGGPLINLRGEVIGINTAIASNSGGSEGIGFAIPINTFVSVARQLVDKGRVDRAFLGVTLDSKFGPAMAAELGLPRPIGTRITAITAKSPAAGGDLRVNDVVLQYETVPVEDDAHLVNLISLTEVGKEVSLIVYRDRRELTVKAKLAALASFPTK